MVMSKAESITTTKSHLDWDEYSRVAASTDRYPNECKPWVYALGLTGEAGEVTDKIKKIYRDKNGIFKSEDREAIAKELGDVLWYLTRLGATLGIDLKSIATTNANKLLDRMKRGVIGGSGDNR
jgi:NTP pyrophosphatase (non-canonical NTP hydrolase)